MQEDKKHELIPDKMAGGRVKAFETGGVLVEGFKTRGEGSKAGHLRVAEEVFRQYTAKEAEVCYIPLSPTK